MVRSIISCVKDKVVKKKEMASAFTSNLVELFLSNCSKWSVKLNVLSEEYLMSPFHNNPWDNEYSGGDDP
jgi:hypothetical protein